MVATCCCCCLGFYLSSQTKVTNLSSSLGESQRSIIFQCYTHHRTPIPLPHVVIIIIALCQNKRFGCNANDSQLDCHESCRCCCCCWAWGTENNLTSSLENISVVVCGGLFYYERCLLLLSLLLVCVRLFKNMKVLVIDVQVSCWCALAS